VYLRYSVGEDKANMASALALRSQIEAALANRIPSALTMPSRILRPVMQTGIDPVDELLEGGLPIGALTEMIGAECTGRTSLALSFVAQITKVEKVCAWVDVSNTLSPESAAACGVDLARLLWVRCGEASAGQTLQSPEGFSLPSKYMVPRPVKKGLHGGGMGSHPRAEAKGMDDAVSGLLRPAATNPLCAEPRRSVRTEREVFEPSARAQHASASILRSTGASGYGRPWSRIEQALKVTDLLLQAGGFAAIVLDMGSIEPEYVSRIPLATWFRYRAAAERTQASILLLTQYACSKSSAGLVLRLTSGDPLSEGTTVLAGFKRRVEVSRQRFTQISERPEKVMSIRKPPQRACTATWRSETAWAGRR
jgi:recombination protein RecA